MSGFISLPGPVAGTAPETMIWGLLILMVPLAMLASLSSGRVDLGPLAVLDVFAAKLGGGLVDPYQAAIVFNARLPRILAAALSGAGLAACGAALQGCFRNPLVGPQTIGVLNGAGFGGSLMIFLGAGQLAVMGGAFAIGLATMLLVVWLARLGGRDSILMLVLAGIVISSLMAAFTTLLQYVADPERQLPQLVFWLMGSFARSTPTTLLWIAPPILIGTALLWAYAFRINILASGEEEAEALGLRVARDRRTILGAVAIVSAAVVSVAGIIGWVGLVVPHLARLVVGPNHSRLIPASALIGAAYLTLVDTLSRSLTAAELPIGAITALLGAPVFIAVLRRSLKAGAMS